MDWHLSVKTADFVLDWALNSDSANSISMVRVSSPGHHYIGDAFSQILSNRLSCDSTSSVFVVQVAVSVPSRTS